MFLLFDVRVCHPNADWYRKMEPQLVYRIHENEKKRQYSRRISDVERGTFTPLVFTTTGGVGKYCLRFQRAFGRAHCLKETRAILHSHLLDKSSSFFCAFAICSCLLKRLQEHQSSVWHEKQSHWYWRCWRSHLLGLFIANFYISQYLTSWLKSKTSRKVQITG